MQASRWKALGFPVRAKSEQRPGEKAKWAVEPPSRALSTLAGPQTIAPTCRLGEPRSRARCRGLRGFKSSSSSSGSRTPVTAVVAGGCDGTTVASPIGARTSPPPRATRRAPANASPSVNSGDERAGGNGPRQGRRRDGSGVPPTPSRLPPPRTLPATWTSHSLGVSTYAVVEEGPAHAARGSPRTEPRAAASSSSELSSSARGQNFEPKLQGRQPASGSARRRSSLPEDREASSLQ